MVSKFAFQFNLYRYTEAFSKNPLWAAARWLEGLLLRRYGIKIARSLANAAPAALGGGIWDASWLGQF
jgi:hypothetical protein